MSHELNRPMTTAEFGGTAPAMVPMPLPPGWVLEGDPAPRGTVALYSPDRRQASGLWECDAGVFDYTFAADELVHVLEGGVVVRDAAGLERTLVPGDFAWFARGTTATWTVETFVKKAFVLVSPDPFPRRDPARRITVVDRSQRARIDALRLAEYAGSRGFAVKAPGILWNRSDDEATILAAWDGDELVATLRVELIEDRALVEAKLECPWDFEAPLGLPAVLLGKMATKREYRKSGLNWALRAAAFELADAWGAKHLVGTFVKGSPRQAQMAEMGYDFFEHPTGWCTTNYRSEDPVLVCALDWPAHRDQAMARCRELAGEALADFPWHGPRPDRRLVTVVS